MPMCIHTYPFSIPKFLTVLGPSPVKTPHGGPANIVFCQVLVKVFTLPSLWIKQV